MNEYPDFNTARRQLDEALQRIESLGELAPATEAPIPPPRRRSVVAAPGGLRRQRRASRRPAPVPPHGDRAPLLVAPPPQETIRLAAGEPPAPAASPGTAAVPPPPVPAGAPADHATPPTTEVLTRLVVGAALLGLDGLAARASRWEAAAGIMRRQAAPAAAVGEIGSGRFRHALIGWIFESEAQLRPRGNPISWLRAVVVYVFSTVFSVVIDLLPLPRLGFRRSKSPGTEPSDEETRRWIERGLAEEAHSRRFAQAALEDIVDNAIVYLARRPAVARALGELVRSPAMDDAVAHIAAGPVVEQAIARVAQSPALDTVVARVAQSPALDTAVSQIVRTPAMEDAVTYLVGTPAMNAAIDTLAQSPALVSLVTTQGTSVATEILDQVRGRAIESDNWAEAVVRRLLRRPPRASLPLELRGMAVVVRERQPKALRGGGDDH